MVEDISKLLLENNMTALSEGKAKVEIGISGTHTRNGELKADEFLPALKGKKAIRKFREMRDNDATIGAIMYAVEQVLRDVPFKVEPANETDAAQKEADFVKGVLDDMEHTLDDHISEALSSLTFGFSLFEVVYKRRVGPQEKNPKKRSKFSDGRMGVRKLASRAQWTVNKFEVDDKTGDCLGVYQEHNYGINKTFIPSNKLLRYRTTTINNDPSGRSILRNAYSSYTYLTNLQSIEAIAVERELHGIPVGRMPSDYMSSDATEDQVSLRNQFIQALRDLKLNEQGYILMPSDLLLDADGKATGGVGSRLMDIELISSNGNRNIEIDPIIKRYQHDIARSVMAEFLMLGGGATGSYALSKSKTDLFLRSVESYINSIFDVINKQLVECLWDLNGLDYDLMPKIVPGDVAPHDLKELGSYLRNLNGANINLSDQIDIVNALLNNAELPLLDEEQYEESKQFNRQVALKPVAEDEDPEEEEVEQNND
jgi:hypothetical protein